MSPASWPGFDQIAGRLLARFALAWLGCAAGLLVAPAEVPVLGGTNDLNALVVRTCREEGPGVLPCERAYLRSGTNSFAFLVPSGLQLQPWLPGSVALVNRDYSCQIIVQVPSPGETDPGELAPEAAAERLALTQSRAKVLNTFSLAADSRRGPAFEIASSQGAGLPRQGIVAFIPSRLGVVEFRLTCAPGSLAAARRQLNTVMLTFRVSDAAGELHISPLSDKL